MTEASTRAKKCRDHAEQCRARAELSENRTIKDEFLKIATQWKTLASEIEEIERMRSFVTTARA